jgi:hypothetical protein
MAARITRYLRRTEITFLAEIDNGRQRIGIHDVASIDIDRANVPAGLTDAEFDEFISAHMTASQHSRRAAGRAPPGIEFPL